MGGPLLGGRRGRRGGGGSCGGSRRRRARFLREGVPDCQGNEDRRGLAVFFLGPRGHVDAVLDFRRERRQPRRAVPIVLGPGGSVDIPLGAKHRVGNPGAEPLVFIEVQYGDYFGEDDIERFEDEFGRI